MNYALFSLKKLPLLSELSLIVLLAWMLVGWFLPQSKEQSAHIMSPIETTSTVLPDINNMIAVKVFGQAPAKPKPVIAAIPKPRAIIRLPLNFKLLGTVVAGDSSAAIIARKQGAKQRAYFIGDTIQAGVTLHSVETHAITVDRNGSLERISLQQGKKLQGSAIIPMRTPPPVQSSRTKHMNRIQVQKQLQNFPALLSQARAIPHFVNGKMAGFSISDIVPGSLYQQAGLRNNDIVVSVNGKKITGAQQAMGIYTTLKNAQSLDLELIRASGIQETVHFDFR